MRFLRARLPFALLFAALCGFTAQAAWAQDISQAAPPPSPQPIGVGQEADNQDQDVQVLARGPIHEAFAQPSVQGSVEILVAPKQPPDPILETPPDVKPEGENVIWIPGYWAWNDDRQDFIWVSGVWRESPPGQTWVEGYWTQAGNGYQWVPGFWTPAQTEEVAYYPEPPASEEQGPTSPSPGPDNFWVPGVWLWQVNQYAWRPGYWARGNADWVWTPASYYWCPRGWVFVDGYWDYPLARRGLLFAPVLFQQAVWRRPHFQYMPRVVVDVGVLTVQLFARPNYCHYYFGDYYAPSYVQHGIIPWYAVREHRYYRYDPLFTYYHWQYSARNPRWDENIRGWYRYYRDNENLRPPHTFAAQQQIVQNNVTVNRTDIRNVVNVQTIQQFRQRNDVNIRLASIPEPQLRQVQDRLRDVRQFTQERQRLETQGRPAAAKVQPAPGIALPGQVPGAKPERVAQGPERVRLPRIPEATLQTARRNQPEVIRGQAPTGEEPTAPAKPSVTPLPKPGERPEAKPPSKSEPTPGKPAIPRDKPEPRVTPAIPGTPTTPGTPPRPPGIQGEEAHPRTPPQPKLPSKQEAPTPPRGVQLNRPEGPTPPMPPGLQPTLEPPGVAAQPGRPATGPIIRGQEPEPRGPESRVRPGAEQPRQPTPPPNLRRETPPAKPEVRRETPRPPAETPRPQPEVRKEVPRPQPEVRREAPRPEPPRAVERPKPSREEPKEKEKKGRE